MASIIECRLCHRRCRLSEGERGDCRVRINLEGKLFSLVYGKPCSVHVDPIEKKPLFHVLPQSRTFSIATAGCNLHCKFCQNWEISQRPPEELRNIDLPPQAVVDHAKHNSCQGIAYTYSDPVIFYEYMFDTAVIARRHGLLNLMITAGFIEEEPLRELCPVIDAANVDLKGITEEYYRDMCSAELAPVLKAIKIMREEGVWVELTNLVIPTWNDQEKNIRDLCRWVVDNVGPDVPLHFSRFWPRHQLNNLPPTPHGTLDTARRIALAEGIHYSYVGNIPGHEGNSTYCPVDGKLLIKREGYHILENNIVDGKCRFCQTPVPGIWSPRDMKEIKDENSMYAS
ncbi:MAG: AmmeMemoRadiSam system radical SAM enzyme [Candidatus Omnitrophica bacterium]|nr:AmmeMemoRadiSam system radical SAM enzyme [Candidatus Omnitrophota bacterium]